MSEALMQEPEVSAIEESPEKRAFREAQESLVLMREELARNRADFETYLANPPAAEITPSSSQEKSAEILERIKSLPELDADPEKNLPVWKACLGDIQAYLATNFDAEVSQLQEKQSVADARWREKRQEFSAIESELDLSRRHLEIEEKTPALIRFLTLGGVGKKISALQEKIRALEYKKKEAKIEMNDADALHETASKDAGAAVRWDSKLKIEQERGMIAGKIKNLPIELGAKYSRNIASFYAAFEEKITDPVILEAEAAGWNSGEAKRFVETYPIDSGKVRSMIQKAIYSTEGKEHIDIKEELKKVFPAEHEWKGYFSNPKRFEGDSAFTYNNILTIPGLAFRTDEIAAWQVLKKNPLIQGYMDVAEIEKEILQDFSKGSYFGMMLELSSFYPEIPLMYMVEQLSKEANSDFHHKNIPVETRRSFLLQEIVKICPDYTEADLDSKQKDFLPSHFKNARPGTAAKLYHDVEKHWRAQEMAFAKENNTSYERSSEFPPGLPFAEITSLLLERHVFSENELGLIMRLCHSSKDIKESFFLDLKNFILLKEAAPIRIEWEGVVRNRSASESFCSLVDLVPENVRGNLEKAFLGNFKNSRGSQAQKDAWNMIEHAFEGTDLQLRKYIMAILGQSGDIEKISAYLKIYAADPKLVSEPWFIHLLESKHEFFDEYHSYYERNQYESTHDYLEDGGGKWPQMAAWKAVGEALVNSNRDSALNAYVYGDNFRDLVHESSNDEAVRFYLDLWEDFPELSRESWFPKFFKKNKDLFSAAEDMELLSAFMKTYSKPGKDFIEGYVDSIRAGVIKQSETGICHELLADFKVLQPGILAEFKKAKETGSEKFLIAELKDVAARMIAGGISKAEQEKPYYKDLISHVYQNNAGEWTAFERNAVCEDRSSDLQKYAIKPSYAIDLFAAGELSLREGQALDTSLASSIRGKISEAKRFSAREELSEDLEKRIGELFEKTIPEKSREGIEARRDKLAAILISKFYHPTEVSDEEVKKLLVEHYFSEKEGFADFAQGTADRVSSAKNKEYAELCEFDGFYRENMKELSKSVIQDFAENPALAKLLKESFSEFKSGETAQKRTDDINKLQIEKLGMSSGFLKQFERILSERYGKKHSEEQIARVVELYERFAGGLAGDKSASAKKGTKEFYGKVKAQREKTAKAVEVLTGKDVDLAGFHLGEVSLKEMLEAELDMIGGAYDEDQFAAYTVQKVTDLFSEERNQIEAELGKFVSTAGEKRQQLTAYITKSKESAHARMVGGVCVSGDNPVKESEVENMWDMPNYLQMVFQNPDTERCAGLVLMHTYEEDGKKILTASLNPSSTYLYSVDEKALFEGIMKNIELFAADNGFDAILLSKNPHIRTNRTGGMFEKAIDERVSSVNKSLDFAKPARFSYKPSYMQQQMDIVWEKK